MEISLNTQAILLLTAPLLVGHASDGEAQPLTPRQYQTFARWLHQNKKCPADLIGKDGETILAMNGCPVERRRLVTLLGRGLALGLALEQWQQRGIWVLSRADADYPKRLKDLVNDSVPPILYGCGDRSLLSETAGITVGCSHPGGGVPVTADAALGAGERAIMILADNLVRAALAADVRSPIQAGRLLLVSLCDPAAGYNACNAALCHKLLSAFVSPGTPFQTKPPPAATHVPETEELPLFTQRWKNSQIKPIRPTEPPAPHTPGQERLTEDGPRVSAAERLLEAVNDILKRELSEPKTDKQIAELLEVTKTQVDAWLKTLMERKLVKKLSKPIRYRVV